MHNGKLAVVMTVYNESLDHLSIAVESTISSLEKVSGSKLIIYVDNYNAMLEPEVINYLKRLKSSIASVVFSNKNLGLAKSLNHVIEEYCSEFEYIGRMDADDICHVDRFSNQMREIIERDIDIIGCNGEKIDDSGNRIGSIRNPEHPSFLYGNEMIHPSLIFRRSVFELLSGYRSYSSAQDYDFLCRAKASDLKIINLQNSLIVYRIREGAIGQQRKKEQLLYKIGISESFRNGSIINKTVTLGEDYRYYDFVENLRSTNFIVYRFLSLFSKLHLKKYALLIFKKLEVGKVR
ncbi:glycosyltransferase [Vibrio fluvialis]|nr:glycosyltransferase [Vibrio fluvialis]